MKLSPEEVRREGYGQHLGRVLETSALESLTLAGGTLALLGGLEAVAAAALMVAWGAGWAQLGLLAAWSVGGAWVAWSYRDERERWTRHRLGPRPRRDREDAGASHPRRPAGPREMERR